MFGRVQALLWPAGGFGRAGRYLARRIIRIKGSPHAIAAGVASGAAVSFLPLPGLHFILGAILALVARGSLLASAVGTFIGNPWTFPLIWVGGYRIGRWLGFGEGAELGEGALGRRLTGVVKDLWQGKFAAAAVDSWPVMAPALVGGGLMAVVVWVSFYFLGRKIVAGYQGRRRQKLEAGRARRQMARTDAATASFGEESKA